MDQSRKCERCFKKSGRVPRKGYFRKPTTWGDFFVKRNLEDNERMIRKKKNRGKSSMLMR